MESRNLKKLLFDVEKACKRIEKFVSNRSLDDFLNNEMLLSAIVKKSQLDSLHSYHSVCSVDNFLSELVA